MTVFESFLFGCAYAWRMRPLSVGRVESAFHQRKITVAGFRSSVKKILQKLFPESRRQRQSLSR
jgi:hypothetical protein